MDAYVGEIRAFAFSFNPKRWLLCRGQLLSIEEYPVLFSVLGNMYGGDGTTNFALPDIQGRVLNGKGQLPGGENYNQGGIGGVTQVTLSESEMPAHNHGFNGASTGALLDAIKVPVAGAYISNSIYKPNPEKQSGNLGRSYAPVSPSPNGILNVASVGLSGDNESHDNMMPYVAVNYCICLSGEFPLSS